MADLGALPSRIVAAVGPCIRQPSYEVASDMRDQVTKRDPADGRFFTPGRREARWQFDLAGYCLARLQSAGVGAVDVVDADTAADEARFFSYRRVTLKGGGPTGHQISIIALAA
jgi:copper oxidase (laccase) domain-containing protein